MREASTTVMANGELSLWATFKRSSQNVTFRNGRWSDIARPAVVGERPRFLASLAKVFSPRVGGVPLVYPEKTSH